MAKAQFWLKNLLIVAICLTLVVITLGAYTRIKDAGLGCPDWPGCFGMITVPQSAEELIQAHEVHGQVVDSSKAWLEMIHRYAAGTLGLLVLFLVAFVHYHKLPMRLFSLVVMGLIIFQALLGMWTVTLLLNPLVVLAHLLGGLCTLVLLGFMYFRNQVFHPVPISKYIKRLSVFAGFVLVVQVILGGWTSTNYAGLACPDLPKCQDKWMPETDFGAAFDVLAMTHVQNYEGGVLSLEARTAIHWSHRLGAVLTLIVLGFLAFELIVNNVLALQKYGYFLATLLVGQFSLGLANVWLKLPVVLAVLHNTGAALLLFLMTCLLSRCFSQKPLELHP